MGHNPFDYLKKLLPELDTVQMGSDELFGSSTMSVTKIESSEKGTNIIPNEVVVYIDYRQTGDDSEANVRAKIQAVLDRIQVPGVSAKVEILYFPLTTYTGVDGEGYQGEYPFTVSAEEPYIQQARRPLRRPWAARSGQSPGLLPRTPDTIPQKASSAWGILPQRSNCAIQLRTASTSR